MIEKLKNWWRRVSGAEARDMHIMQLAAISTATWANTEASKADRIGPSSPWYSTAYKDVCDAVDREMMHRGRAEELENETLSLRGKLNAATAAINRLSFTTEYAGEEPVWTPEMAAAWKHFLATHEAGRAIQRLTNFHEQQTNRAAVHRTSGTEQNVGYARGWHDCTVYFFKTLSADARPQQGTDAQAPGDAEPLRERLAS